MAKHTESHFRVQLPQGWFGAPIHTLAYNDKALGQFELRQLSKSDCEHINLSKSEKGINKISYRVSTKTC